MDVGELSLVRQGFGKYTRAAYRIGQKYPRYAGKLLRQAISKDSEGLNSAELADVVENSVVPAFQPAVAEAAGIEALEAAGTIAFPEVAAAVALGGLAIYAFHKMAGGKKISQFTVPPLNLPGIREGLGAKGKKDRARKIRASGGQANSTWRPTKINQPIATGEVIHGAYTSTKSIPNGQRLFGREVIGTTRGAVSASAFTMAGAFVATPLAYPGSRMGVMSKTYAKYNIRRWNVRVITASPTSDDGQILTYFHHNRHDPVLNWTSTGFITTVLSAQNAVVGPKWKDSHLPVALTNKVLECSFPLGDGHFDLGSGDVFVFTRSSSADSYIVMCEYEIDFTEPQIMSRINLVPFARAQWLYVGYGDNYNWTINSTTPTLFAPGGLTGTDGTASGEQPSGNTVGDIYRFVCDTTNSIFTTSTGTTLTAANVFNHQAPDNGAISLTNGSTIYCVFVGSGGFRFFPTLSTARTYTNQFRAGLTGTGVIRIVGWMCLVDSMQGSLLQSSV